MCRLELETDCMDLQSPKRLNPEESNTITSILDEEELQLDRSTNIAELDEKCRAIWPEWQPSSPSPSKVRSPITNRMAAVEDMRSPVGQYELKLSPGPEEIESIPLDQLDVDSLKADVDALFLKITALTGGTHTSPPRARQGSADPQFDDFPVLQQERPINDVDNDPSAY